MTEQKDPLNMIRAFAAFSYHHPDAYLLMIGDGELRAGAQALAKELMIGERVIFSGFRNDVPALLNSIDVYCLPSLWEGFSIGLLEAMAMEKPVIASAVDGTREILENKKNSLLIPPGDTAELTQALLLIYNDASLRETLKREAYNAITQEFNAKKVADSAAHIYLNLLSKKKLMNTISLPQYQRIADKKRLDYILTNARKHLKPGAKILDIGCGNGIISMHLGTLGFEVMGIDVSDKTIAAAQQKNTLPNVTFIRKSAEELSAEGHLFDAIVCSEVLEHLNEPGGLLQKISKILASNGILIATVPNGMGPREVFVTKPMLYLQKKNNLLTKMVKGVKKLLGYSGKTVQSDADYLDHIQFFSYHDLKRLLNNNQFTMIDFGKANFVDDVFPFSFFANRFKALQKFDCKVADYLPRTFTGGFFTVSVKK